jgi:hypothetical protein
MAGTASDDSTDDTILKTGLDLRGQKWAYVRIISGAGDGQVAEVRSLKNGFIRIDEVWKTGTTTSLATLTAASPSRGTWFTRPKKGDQFVLVEGTKFWKNGAPAFVTVKEVLADASLRAVNLAAQGQINAIKTALDAAAGGAGSLTFLRVPVLFVGDATGFATNRKARALTPDLANLQTAGGKFFFPRQFGAKNAAGQDIFEAAAKAVVPGALFVDDWYGYHINSGEVHCATQTKRALPTFPGPKDPAKDLGWWSKLA